MEAMNTQKIFAAFVKAQSGFAPALKSSVNPHFRSKYADLAACVEAVIDALNSNGIGLIQKTHADDSGVTVETVFVHESGESFSAGMIHVPASKQDAQGYGSALTYARRYGLMASCGIAPEDDDGNAAVARKKESFKSEPTSAWDKMDAETKEWMMSEAMAVTVLINDGDIKGAYYHLESLELDDEFKTAFWSRLDATQRSAIKAYSSLVHAKDLDALEKAWKAVPKHSLKPLEQVKERMKDELSKAQ